MCNLSTPMLVVILLEVNKYENKYAHRGECKLCPEALTGTYSVSEVLSETKTPVRIEEKICTVENVHRGNAECPEALTGSCNVSEVLSET